MNWNLFALLVPYIIGFTIPVGVGIYTYRHRSVSGALQFSWYILARSAWNLGLIFEILTPTLRGKIFWNLFQGSSLALTVFLISIFVLAYIDYKPKNIKLTLCLLAIVPLFFFILTITNNLHHLFIQDAALEPLNPYSLLQYKFTPLDLAFSLYSFILVFILLGILIGKFLPAQSLHRSNAFIIAIGILADSLGLGVVAALNQRSMISFASAIACLIIAWGLFRYRLFNLLPIARDALFEKMSDLVIILDSQDRIVDINPSALKAFNLTSGLVMGKPVAEFFFSEWEEFREPLEGSKEYYVKRDDKYLHFDVHTTILRGSRGEYQGRIFIARDITSYAALQWQFKTLNEELLALNAGLEDRVKQRTQELAEAYDTTLQGWARALELRDKETEGHSRRVIDMTLDLARALDVAETDMDDIRRGALLHDIGKMAIPDEILLKADELTPQEREIVSQHPTIAYNLLLPIDFLKKALEIPYCHHEKWDGTGYPRGLHGEEIPLSARIFAVVDVWDAIQTNRIYRKAWSRSKARAYMQQQASHYFDPNIVNTFLDLMSRGRI